MTAPAAPRDEPLGEEGVPWRVLDAALIFLFALVATVIVVAIADRLLPEDWNPTLAVILSFAGLTGATTLYLAGRYPGSLPRLLGRARAIRPRDLAAGALHGVAGFFAVNVAVGVIVRVAARAADAEVPEPQETLRELLDRPQVLVVIGLVLLAPLAEELFFRGVLYQALRRHLWRWPAIGWSALLFALLHVQTGTAAQRLVVFCVVFPFGLYMAWVFERRGTLAAPVAMHVVFNGLGAIAITAGLG